MQRVLVRDEKTKKYHKQGLQGKQVRQEGCIWKPIPLISTHKQTEL